jgi:hypothetical protein
MGGLGNCGWLGSEFSQGLSENGIRSWVAVYYLKMSSFVTYPCALKSYILYLKTCPKALPHHLVTIYFSNFSVLPLSPKNINSQALENQLISAYDPFGPLPNRPMYI